MATKYQRLYPDGIPASDDLPRATHSVYRRRWDVTMMHINEGLSFQEIADREGLAPKTVQHYVSQSLIKYEQVQHNCSDIGGIAGLLALRAEREAQS